ncbi:MAG: hypothetical protein DCC52_09340 [Chloroflexi bacterium]|nr:MAG: hypothetical protein DCC52_09340 [Chloroflexota bacterium]
MRESNTRTVVEQKPLGIIEAVSAGLSLVWRRPWTLLIPIVADVLIWALPRLSLTQLVHPYMSEMLRAVAMSGDPEVARQAQQTFEELAQSLNLLGLVATALNGVARFPSLFQLDLLRATMLNVPGPINALAYSQPLLTAEWVVILFVPLFFLGLLPVAVYLELIAQGARPLETETRDTVLLRIARLWLRLMGYALLLFGILTAVRFLLSFVQALAGGELATFGALMVSVALFWVFIYFFFVVSALAVGGIGLRAALQRSAFLFRAFFWTTIGLVALIVFLDRGLAMIWDGLAVSAFGVALAIVANAYIGTSLLAASMIYYQDRMNLIERWQQRAKSARNVK